MYWSEEKDIIAGIVQNYMPKNIYFEKMRNFYFSDRTNIRMVNVI